MSLTLRIFIAYFVIVVVAGAVFFNTFISELKPGMRQSAEHSLIDTANVLAELVVEDFVNSKDNFEDFSKAINNFLSRSYNAEIYSVNRQDSNLRVYITDAEGIVRYDSSGVDVGADYSQWNDVYLTLRGEYGARSTKSNPQDEFSSVMHVAAPIIYEQQIIGVLTVAKPNYTVQPFIDLAYQKLLYRGILVVVLSLLVALLIVFLLTRSIKKLVIYADSVSQGKNASLPTLYESELNKLASSIENMKNELEGKAYVEKYVHTLTHELKSPIAAIKGANELMSPSMPAEYQQRFIRNIDNEINRINDMVNRLLSLASVEKQESLGDLDTIVLFDLLNQLINSKETQTKQKAISIDLRCDKSLQIRADNFLLTQALDNLLQNAIEFANENSQITAAVTIDKDIAIQINNTGPLIPEYAKSKIFDRFYSLPHPATGKKSSGLGLCFVEQIAHLHGGSITLNNLSDGVSALLSLPISPKT